MSDKLKFWIDRKLFKENHFRLFPGGMDGRINIVLSIVDIQLDTISNRGVPEKILRVDCIFVEIYLYGGNLY